MSTSRYVKCRDESFAFRCFFAACRVRSERCLLSVRLPPLTATTSTATTADMTRNSLNTFESSVPRISSCQRKRSSSCLNKKEHTRTRDPAKSRQHWSLVSSPLISCDNVGICLIILVLIPGNEMKVQAWRSNSRQIRSPLSLWLSQDVFQPHNRGTPGLETMSELLWRFWLNLIRLWGEDVHQN